MKTPAILILTKEPSVYTTFQETLREIFGKSVRFMSNHFPPVDMDTIDLILASGTKNAHSNILDVTQYDIPFLKANRSIDFNKLEKLLDLPAKTKCLLVSNEVDIANESVSLLNRLGFDYLDVTPYSPDMKNIPALKSFDVAITHGLSQLVPREIEKTIDLGDRSLDLSTIFEISAALHLFLDQTHLFATEYFRNFVRVGRKLATSVKNEKFLNKQLETVLDAVHEGIISVDADGMITVFNEDAVQILGVKQENIIGKHYSEIVRDMHIEEVMGQTKEIPRQVIQMQGLQILITKTPIVVDQSFSGAVVTFQDVSHVMRMEEEIRRKKVLSGLDTRYTFNDIIGTSAKMEQTKTIAKKLARSEYTILIHGESGTGKEIFAQAIHDYSSRKHGPFVAVNFAGITPSLAESELFGYDEGAFTGARKGGKAGLFELAQNGTIFLDEIGDAPPNIQAAILRVLQEKQVMRVGSSKVTPVNVRIIAATNQDLEEMMTAKTFREDLFYRLNQLPLELLPLRERKEDIDALIDYFLRKRNIQVRFTPDLRERLTNYHWPGNIRELEATIHYLTVAADGMVASVDHLPPQMKRKLVSNHSTNLTVRMLQRREDTHILRNILEILSLYQSQNSGIGRGVLLSMMDIELTEGQLRTKLEILRECECIAVGTKKQGTKITKLGRHVLSQI